MHKFMENPPPPRAIYDKRGDEHHFDQAVSLLTGKIVENLKKRMEQGENQQQFLMSIRAIQSGTFNEEDEKNLEDLIIEANTELDMVKLPSRFKSRIKEITHLYKKKVADQLMSSTVQRLLGSQGVSKAELVGLSGIRGDARQRQALDLSLEVLERLQKMKSLSLREIAEDTDFFELFEKQLVSYNLEKRSFELVKNEADAKLHRLVLNPNDEDIPDNLELMTPEELIANEINFFKASDLMFDETGQLMKQQIDRTNFEKVAERLEFLYDKKNAKNQTSPATDSADPQIEQK